VECHPLEAGIRIEVSDAGCGFDPVTAGVGERATGPDERGGLGLYLIHKLMHETEVVSRPGGGTRVIMVKRFARD
jgi:anti-sigma regulatory factor (Ser/Thr protein kinase)